MGIFSYETEEVSSVPAAKLYKAFVLDSNNVFPKAFPQAISSYDTVEGDGGPGSIKKLTYGQDGQAGYVKHKVDAIDKENYVYHYSLVEGAYLQDTLEKISFENKFEATPDGGSIVKTVAKYFTKGDVQLSPEELNAGKERATEFFKAIEGYLLANPDYN